MPTPPPCNRHILVVEDDMPTREALALVLGAAGYRVTTAADGLAALEQLRGGDYPALILLDLMMPVMDGWQFRQEQLRDPALQDIPVIVCSASGRAGQRAASLCAIACIDKPVEPVELLGAIRRCCPIHAG